MKPTPHSRREELWKRYVLFGEPREEVVADVAADFDVTPETIADDLQGIDAWLPELDVRRDVTGISLLAELRVNRQRLHQLAHDANSEEDITAERQIREEINRSLDLERRLLEGSVTTQIDELDQLMSELG